MVGGDQSTFDNAKPILEKMGKNIVYCGNSGNGQGKKKKIKIKIKIKKKFY